MRRLLAMITAVSILGLATHARADDWDDQAQAEQDAQVSQEQFQQQLAPYGQWEDDNSYGEVFYPNVAASWRPYVYGRWAWTEYGWMWVSDEPFGWAVYHYGRWWFNPYQHRWGWVPGYEWAPAWVVWRFGSTAVGWAPLYVGYDAWSDDYPVYYDHWVYVPCEHFYGGPVYSYVYSPSAVRTVYYSTSSVHGYVGTTSYGPPTTYVQSHSAVPVQTTQVVHSAQPPAAGQSFAGNEIHLYQTPSTHIYNPTRTSPSAERGMGAARTPVVAPSNVHLAPGVQHATQQPRPTYTGQATSSPTRTFPSNMPEPSRQANPAYGERPERPQPFQGQNQKRATSYNPPQPASQPGQPNRRQQLQPPKQQAAPHRQAPPSTPQHTFNVPRTPIPTRAPMFANAGGFHGQPSLAAPQQARRPAPPAQKNRR